ncbi:MAG: A24 family peptidase [Myxococcales bacterium]|nr:A24 family peptidase [Myxococcales bacterium]
MIAHPQVLVLWIGLLTAALTDIRDGKIPNWLTVPMMVSGIAIHAVVSDPAWTGLVGCVAAFVLHFLLFALGVQKGGDAKLMMGIGACVGVAEMIEATCWWAILYLPVGMLTLAVRGRLGNLLAALRYTVRRSLGQPAGERPEPTMMIAGPTLAVSGFLANLTDWLEGLLPW